MVHKVIIIGSGPAGLTAGIYTGRANLSPLIIEGNQPGGQLMTTTDVENWPGNIKIQGPELMMRIKEHAKTYNSNFVSDVVTSVDFSTSPYKLILQSTTTLEAQSIIIASGASHKKLDVKGEQEYWGKGITTCATCDAPFYKNKEVVIVGGGNTAVTEASVLSKFAQKVTIIQNLDTLTANDPIKDVILTDPKINVIYHSIVTEIQGDEQHVTGVIIKNTQTNETTHIPTSGVFVAIGFKPNTRLFKGQLDMDKYGYLKLLDYTKTSKEGIFAAGDVADARYMQAITAAGFGCMAALDCEAYLRKQAQ